MRLRRLERSQLMEAAVEGQIGGIARINPLDRRLAVDEIAPAVDDPRESVIHVRQAIGGNVSRMIIPLIDAPAGEISHHPPFLPAKARPEPERTDQRDDRAAERHGALRCQSPRYATVP